MLGSVLVDDAASLCRHWRNLYFIRMLAETWNGLRIALEVLSTGDCRPHLLGA